MRDRKLIPALALLMLLAGAAQAAPAKAPAKAAKAKAAAAALPDQALTVGGLELSLQGDSTLHKWEAKAASVSLTASLQGGASSVLERIKAGAPLALVLSVEVTSLHSPEGSSMNSNMHKAMHAKEHPQVSFKLSRYSLKGADLEAQGALEINGVAKDVTLKGTAVEKDGKLSVQGAYELLMSEYQIPPPVMMLGTIKTRDRVKVVFAFTLGGA